VGSKLWFDMSTWKGKQRKCDELGHNRMEERLRIEITERTRFDIVTSDCRGKLEILQILSVLLFARFNMAGYESCELASCVQTGFKSRCCAISKIAS
jgi:hypothetical protein